MYLSALSSVSLLRDPKQLFNKLWLLIPMSSIAPFSNLAMLSADQNNVAGAGAGAGAARSPRLGVPTAREARTTNLSLSSTTTTTTRGVGAPRAAVTEVVKVEREGERKGKERGGVLRVGVVCGGPSAERGISLNSARSVLDHIQVTIPEFSFWLFGFWESGGEKRFG